MCAYFFTLLAALFFVTYDEVKAAMQPHVPAHYHTAIHMGAATLAEMVH